MTELSRVRSVWSGFPGGPGVTTMYFLDTATAVASVHAFWTTLGGMLPGDVSIQVQNAGDIIEDSTGALTGAWSATAVAAVGGGSSNKYAAPAGAVINWLTETIGPHRRLRGRSFIVPIEGDSFQSNGSLDPTKLGYLQSAADDLVASQSASFVVWHRGTGSDGTNGLVTAASVHDFVAVLRSRRD